MNPAEVMEQFDRITVENDHAYEICGLGFMLDFIAHCSIISLNCSFLLVSCVIYPSTFYFIFI